jgi:tetratricopeptide (TPR) repeat protein
MLKRIYPLFVSMTGVVGLAAALSYLAGAYLAFQPGWEAWAEFFVPLAAPFLVIPYVFLLGHLYLRARLGAWFLRRGLVEEAIAYCEPRLERNLLRSRAEALNHRISLARAYIWRGDYERARGLLESGYKIPAKGRTALAIGRWRMEVALRQENLLRCRQAWESVSGLARPASVRCYIDACRAELAVREGRRDEFDRALDRAKWKGAGLARVQLAELLGALRFGDGLVANDLERTADMIAALDAIKPSILAEMPGRAGELVAIRAEVLYRGGQAEQARQEFASHDSVECDARSEYAIARVRELLGPSQTSHSPKSHSPISQSEKSQSEIENSRKN